MSFFDWVLTGAALWLGWVVAPYLLLFVVGGLAMAWLAVSELAQKLKKGKPRP